MRNTQRLELPRHLPQPVPPVHAKPEYLAEGALRTDYEDVKAVLQVPWMGVIAMAHAHFRTFFRYFWDGYRPLAQSQPFVDACFALRAHVEEAVDVLMATPLRDTLAEQGYAPREIAGITDMIEVFSHGNFPYLLMSTASRLLIEGQELSEARLAPPCTHPHAPDADVPFVLIERHHADAPTQAIYDDIMATLGLPFVNTDYRALARWPSYFAGAWSGLKPKVGTATYEALVTEIHDVVVETVLSLPNPGALESKGLIDAARSDAPLEAVRDMTRLFQWLLPGLVVNVAFFKAQLR
ncbi:MAG: hypothetical protein R3E48_03120 [Burkholderiaceae bacterium]